MAEDNGGTSGDLKVPKLKQLFATAKSMGEFIRTWAAILLACVSVIIAVLMLHQTVMANDERSRSNQATLDKMVPLMCGMCFYNIPTSEWERVCMVGDCAKFRPFGRKEN